MDMYNFRLVYMQLGIVNELIVEYLLVLFLKRICFFLSYTFITAYTYPLVG